VTQQITEEFARRDSRIQLIRQPINLGAQGNFLWLLQQARGEYFMWAAHDDGWSKNYVEVLSRCLSAHPKAVLATGITEVESIDEKGKVSHCTTKCAPNADRWKTVDVLTEEFACVWIYGLFRTDWVRNSAHELLNYPFHYGDLIWLFGMTATEQVVGDPEATFFYHQLRGKYKERTYRKKIELWGRVAFHLVGLSLTRLPARERFTALKKACWLVYRHHINRGNILGTTVRITKLAVLWTIFGIEALLRKFVSLFTRPQRMPVDSTPHSLTGLIRKDGADGRKAA
jgi:hypothetical protein